MSAFINKDRLKIDPSVDNLRLKPDQGEFLSAVAASEKGDSLSGFGILGRPGTGRGTGIKSLGR